MALKSHQSKGLRIAVEGCGHGTLNAIYSSIRKTCDINKWEGIDLLIIGGDFQAVRNANDLNCMSVPVKYREIGDFHEYYSGLRKAPYLTVFVGGNHEASNHLWELYYGGWVAPNIYYLGAANVIRLGPLRIAGLSGIWKGYNYNKPHYERIPYNQDDIKSSYHVRELDVRKLLQIRTQVDVGLSHDWPKGIEWEGDYKTLFRQKDGFEVDARAGTLGSAAAKYILDRLRPPHWFSAHLHVKFSAVLEHEKSIENRDLDSTPLDKSSTNGNRLQSSLGLGQIPEVAPSVAPDPVVNSEKIDISLEDDTDDSMPAADNGPDKKSQNLDDDEGKLPKTGPNTPVVQFSDVPEAIRSQLPESFKRRTKSPHLPLPSGITNKTTRFLALDKCLPNRKFLQLLNIEPLGSTPETNTDIVRPLRLEYDKEWLAITRVFASELTLGDPAASVTPNKGESHYRPLIEKEMRWVEENVVMQEKMTIPENFQITAPTYDPGTGSSTMQGPREYTNPQTTAFCDLLQVKNPFDATEEERGARLSAGPRPNQPRLARNVRGGGFRGGGRGRGRGRGRRFG